MKSLILPWHMPFVSAWGTYLAFHKLHSGCVCRLSCPKAAGQNPAKVSKHVAHRSNTHNADLTASDSPSSTLHSLKLFETLSRCANLFRRKKRQFYTPWQLLESGPRTGVWWWLSSRLPTIWWNSSAVPSHESKPGFQSSLAGPV